MAMARAVDYFDPPKSEYLYDPVAWTEDRLKEEVWSKQADLMDAVADHRHVAVRSAHATGKSWAAARLTCWWLDVHPPGEAFVVTSAPTQPQVEAVLWREIGRAHVRGSLDGRITSGMVPMWKMGNEIIAYGRKPADYRDTEKAMQAFQGIHARFILVMLDEACGIPQWLWDATETLATNQDSRVLAIGNPDDPAAYFEKVCRPGSGWRKLKISAFDTPAFTGEQVSERLLQSLVSQQWVEERKKRWGPKSMLYRSKVEAEFPDVSDDTLITPGMVLRAQQNELPGLAPGRFACDIARWGDDETVIGRNRDGVFRVEEVIPKADTMETAGRIAKRMLDLKLEAPAVIDVIGVGSGVFDRLSEQRLPVAAFNSSYAAAQPKKFKNLRAEMWWNVRVLLEDNLIDLDEADETLAIELTSIKYFIDSSGRIQIEPKEETKKRIGRSPDRADTFMMSCWQGSDWRPPKRDRRYPSSGITDDLLDRAL